MIEHELAVQTLQLQTTTVNGNACELRASNLPQVFSIFKGKQARNNVSLHALILTKSHRNSGNIVKPHNI